MEANEKELNPERSIQIIESMIQRTKTNLHDSSFYFLLWGWIILIVDIGQILLKYTNYKETYWLWLLVIPGIIASFVYGMRQGKKQKVSTHLDRVNFTIWMAFLVCYFTVIIFMKELNYNITPIIFLLAGNATFLTGIVIKFRSLIWGGIIFWVGVLLLFLLPGEYSQYIVPVVIILGYLIPGYILRKQNRKDA